MTRLKMDIRKTTKTLVCLVHVGFDHIVVWINRVKPILGKGKPIVRWGHKAIGSRNGITWLQKGAHYDAPNLNDNNCSMSNHSHNFTFYLGWPTKCQIKAQKTKAYFDQNKRIANRHLSPLIKPMDLLYSHILGKIDMKPILEKGKPIARWGHKAIPIFPEKI